MVKVKVKNQGSIPSDRCKIILEGISSQIPQPCSDSYRQQRMIFEMPTIQAGGTITGILPYRCGELGDPRREYGISVTVNRPGFSNAMESNYSNNELRINISGLNVIEDNTVPPLSSRRNATWIE